MFSILQTQKTEKRKLRRGKTVKSVTSVSVGSGTGFRIVSAYESRSGIAWNEIFDAADGDILLPADIRYGGNSRRIMRIDDSLERMVFVNTVTDILRYMRKNRIFTSVTLFCTQPEFARFLPYLGCAKEFFTLNGGEPFRSEMMDNYGISVRTADGNAVTDKGFFADTEEMYMAVNGTVYYPWRFAENDFRLSLCPGNVCRTDFLFALYTYCGCTELEKLSYTSFLCGGNGKTFAELVNCIK